MKKFARLLCAAVLLFAAICVPAAAYEISVPEQDEDGYYLIGTAEELFWYATEGAKLDEIINVKLTADINVNPDYKIHDNGKVTYADGSKIPGVTFTLMDNGMMKYSISSNDSGDKFREEFIFWDSYAALSTSVDGVFDGQEYTISGLYCANDSETMGMHTDGTGLFSTVTGTVKNLGIVDSYICSIYDTNSMGGSYFGVLCNMNYGIIDNCYSDVVLYGWEYIGGLCSQNFGIIKNSYFSGNMIGWQHCYGGVCGYNTQNATIENCYNKGTIGAWSSNECFPAGVCGTNYGTISGCYNEGNVKGSNGAGVCTRNYAGGLIENCYNTGRFGNMNNGSGVGICYLNEGTVNRCYNTYSSTVTYSDGFLAGIAYENKGTISMCYNTGSFTAPGAYVAGICLKNNNRNGIVENCYNTGTINGTNIKIGGICAENTAGTIRNCYNIGSVTGKYWAGAIVGNKTAGTVNNCYYLSGCAKDVSGTIQQGIGASATGSITSDTTSYTCPLTIGEFSSGKAAYLLRTNGTVAGEWTQTLPAQLFPGFDGKVVEYNSVTDTYYNSTEGITIAGGGAELILTKNLVQVNKVRIPGQLILASYSREGQLLDAVIVPVYADTDITLTGSGLDTNGAYSVRAMVFMNMIDLLPMCEAKSVNL